MDRNTFVGWLAEFAVGQGVDALMEGWSWQEALLATLLMEGALMLGKMVLSEWVERRVVLVRENMPMNTDYVFTPLGASPDEIAEFVTLRPGIPDYMRESVIAWRQHGRAGYNLADVGFLVRFQTAAKTNLGIKADLTIDNDGLNAYLRNMDHDVFANLIHFVLSELFVSPGGTGSSNDRVRQLEAILSTGGSSYTVGKVQSRYGLVERVPAAVADTVEEVISSSGKASSLLSKAWEQAFGMNKNPSHAYYDAVKAVEVLSCPIFSPKDGNATLGKDINVLRNNAGKFEFVMPDSKHNTSLEHVVSMMQLLWHSHTDRHGSGDYEDVTVDQAQAAVLLSSTLVGWLSKGMISRKTD